MQKRTVMAQQRTQPKYFYANRWHRVAIVAAITLLSLLTVDVLAVQDYDDLSDQTPQLVVDADGFTAVSISHVALSSDGRFLAASAGKTVRVWDLPNRKLWATLRGYQERQGYHIGFIDSLSFSPNGQFLTVGVSDNTELGSTREYDLSKPDELRRLIPGQGGCTRNADYSPDGKYLVSYG